MMQNTTKTQSSSETRSFWIWQGIIVGASPVVGYGLAFLYELGFCGEFKIPIEFITLNLTSVFVAAGSLVVIGLILYWFAELFLMLVPVRKSPLFRELVLLLLLLLYYLGLVILFWGIWEIVIYATIVVLFLILLLFVFPLFRQRGKGSYIEKLRTQWKRDLEYKGILDYLIRLLGVRAFLVIFVVIYILLFSYLAGGAKAMKQEEFLVPSTYPHSVVLRIYGENMICAPFDAKEKEIQKIFFIIRMTDEPRPMLQLQKIGPLRVKGEQ